MKEKQFVQIWKLWEIFGKFWKMQCSSWAFHTLGRVCVQIFSSISQKLLKTPQCVSPKKIISPKKCIFQKNFYSDKWFIPENCVFIKKSVSPEKRVSPEKMFHLKNLTNPIKVFKRKQHLCVDSEFSKPHFSKST